jgi:cob(I)alamin adenosyltransferase
VCRRCERLVVALAQHEDTGLTVQYLNRLSDALFVWGRWAAHKHGQPEPLWDTRGT